MGYVVTKEIVSKHDLLERLKVETSVELGLPIGSWYLGQGDLMEEPKRKPDWVGVLRLRNKNDNEPMGSGSTGSTGSFFDDSCFADRYSVL